MSQDDNLLHETLSVMEQHQLTPGDVEWVGKRDGSLVMTWDDFAACADFAYDGGFGTQEIDEDLVVVFKDAWLERHEHDGSEWWEYKIIPQAQPDAKRAALVDDREHNWCGNYLVKEVESE